MEPAPPAIGPGVEAHPGVHHGSGAPDRWRVKRQDTVDAVDAVTRHIETVDRKQSKKPAPQTTHKTKEQTITLMLSFLQNCAGTTQKMFPHADHAGSQAEVSVSPRASLLRALCILFWMASQRSIAKLPT